MACHGLCGRPIGQRCNGSAEGQFQNVRAITFAHRAKKQIRAAHVHMADTADHMAGLHEGGLVGAVEYRDHPFGAGQIGGRIGAKWPGLDIDQMQDSNRPVRRRNPKPIADKSAQIGSGRRPSVDGAGHGRTRWGQAQ